MSNWKENIEIEENQNLAPCKVCHKNISKYASLCPHCGEGAPWISIKTKMNLLIASIISGIIFIGFLFYAQYKIKEKFSNMGIEMQQSLNKAFNHNKY